MPSVVDTPAQCPAARAIDAHRRTVVVLPLVPVTRATGTSLTASQSISAGYAATLNTIWFPAAKFRLPFFDLDRDPALNYGAIGATIAHEITHALDDEGRQYDADGLGGTGRRRDDVLENAAAAAPVFLRRAVEDRKSVV